MKTLTHILQSTLAALALAAVGTYSAHAVVITLDFEGIGNLNPVGNYYNGGAGPNYGIQFSADTLAIVDADAGGTGNFGGEPSPDTIMFFLTGSASILDFAAGFDTGFSFFYTAINQPGSITIYDAVGGAGGGGAILGSLALPLTTSNGAPDPTGAFSPLFPIGVAFAGTGKSIEFSGAQDQIGFDNITFGSATPTGVPDGGSSILLLGLGLVGLAGSFRRRSA